MSLFEQPLLLLLALVALYSPIAALPSYFPVVGGLDGHEQRRLAIALFVNASVFALVALWVGEPLLEILGLSTAALTATGGIALLYEGVALMRGTAHHPSVDDVGKAPAAEPTTVGGQQALAVQAAPVKTENWRRVAFVPVTFPLTVGGTTFAFFVAFRAEADTTVDVLLLSVAGLVYAAVTGLTLYASGHVQRRAKPATAAFLDRIAGILLTAIAVTILISGVTNLVLDVIAGR
jgi:multiple antibiotic resistance protein